MITKSNVADVFTYQSPTPADERKYAAIRDAGLNLAAVILAATKVGADQQAALRKVREAVMTANAAVALANIAEPI